MLVYLLLVAQRFVARRFLVWPHDPNCSSTWCYPYTLPIIMFSGTLLSPYKRFTLTFPAFHM
ncbi:hypothetical protein Hanom_Chr14g01255791 [Helianthus anomalus]